MFAWSLRPSFSVGCGSDDAHPSVLPETDSGAANDTGVPQAIDRGVVSDYGSGKALAGITVQEGGMTATTDSKGAFQLSVPKDKPVSLVLTGPDYIKTIIGEVSISSTYDRIIPLPPASLFHLGQSALDGLDKTKGLVYLLVRTTGSCTSNEGAKITVVTPADGKLAYFDGKLPDPALTAVKSSGDPDLPSAVLYNVPIGSSIDVKIEHATCKLAPFPVTVGGVTYLGKVAVEPGDANSVLHYYLQ